MLSTFSLSASAITKINENTSLNNKIDFTYYKRGYKYYKNKQNRSKHIALSITDD